MDCAALRHNARLARERIGPGTALLAVVKANGYGHGMVEVAQALREEAELFGVANLHEAMELRAGGIRHPILILGPSLPEERGAINDHGFIATVSSWEEARAFERNPAGINFAIDTGMGRMGCWQDDAMAELEKISRIPELKLHSVSTHLPVADEDAAFTKEELVRFEDIVREMRAPRSGALPCARPAQRRDPCFSEHKFDLVRAGLMLYGSSPVPSEQHFLQPVMALKSRVALLRRPAGGSEPELWPDIYHYRGRCGSRRSVPVMPTVFRVRFPIATAAVLVGGRRCPVLGRVTMDLTMVDVSAVPGVKLGDEVVLIGKQGSEEILVGGSGRTRRDDRMGDLYRHWQPGTRGCISDS